VSRTTLLRGFNGHKDGVPNRDAAAFAGITVALRLSEAVGIS
jgi:hypothetical protein